MGIGINKFLKIVEAALSALSIKSLKAVVIDGDVYLNKKLGILFHKPTSWGFVHVKEFGKLKKEQILANGWDAYKDEVWEDLGSPICMITKHYIHTAENKGIFSPTITLNITPKKELKELECESFEEVIALSELGAEQFLKKFKVIKRYEPYYICDCLFYEFDATYYFEHVDIQEPLKIELKVLKIEHNGFYYDFNLHQSNAQNQTAVEEFEAFKQSIKLI